MASFGFSDRYAAGVVGESEGDLTPTRGSNRTEQSNHGAIYDNQQNQIAPHDTHDWLLATSSSWTDLNPTDAYDNQQNQQGSYYARDWQAVTPFPSTDVTPSNASFDNPQQPFGPHYTQDWQTATTLSSTDVTSSMASYDNQQNHLGPHHTRDGQAATATFSSTGVTPPSAGSNGVQPPTAFPSTNVTPPDTVPADRWFWDTTDNMTTFDGVRFNGTYAKLRNTHPDLRQQIDAMYQGMKDFYNLTDTTDVDVGRGGNDVAALVESAESQESLEDPTQALLEAVDQTNALASQSTSRRPRTKKARNPMTKMARSTATANASTVPHPQTVPSNNLATNFTQGDESEEAGIEQEQEAETETGEDTNNATKTPATALRQPLANVPQYVPDIASIKDAHSIIDNPDPATCRKLKIRGDDVEEVKSQKMHVYAKKLFDAMLTPGVKAPAGTVLTAEAQQKFDRQQGSLTKIQDQLKTKNQQKQARANCILAFEAAVFAHEVGVPKDLYDQFEKKGTTKADRSTHLDTTSICSERLEKMVDQVRDYKLVAIDLLNGKRMHRLAWDPVYYSEQKIEYLLSNTSRDATYKRNKLAREQAEAQGKLDAKTGPVKKRKRTAEADPEQDATKEGEEHEEEGEGDEEPSAKRARQDT